MFKFMAKLAVFSVVLTGVVLLYGGKVSAARDCLWAPDPTWGVNSGDHSNIMGGLKVRAFNGQNNQPLNINYEIKSDLYGPQGSRNGHDVDARLFQYPAGSGGRDAQHWFNTGETIHANSGTESHSEACNGWSVLGPGTAGSQYPISAQWGNGWVLDCGEEISGTRYNTRFWISDISTPSGDAGRWGGRWSVQVDGQIKTNNLAENPMNPTDKFFEIINGETKLVSLIWHPNPPEDPPPPTGECNLIRFTIPNDNQDNQGGASNTSDYAIYVNDGGTPGNPAEAGSADYQEPNVYGSPPGPGVDYSGTVTEPQHGGIPGATVEKNLRLDKKVVSGTLRYAVVIYDRFTNTNGNNVLKVRSRFTNVVNNCYQATCSIQITENVPGKGSGSNAVRAGQKFSGRVRITSTASNNIPSALITNSGNFQLAATTNWFGGFRPLPLPQNLPNAGSYGDISFATFDFIAPNTVGSHELRMYPDFWGWGRIGPDCPVTINTYKEFSLNVSAQVSLNPTTEDPSTSVYTGSATPTGPYFTPPEVGNFRVNYNATSYRQPYPAPTGTPVNSSSGFNPIPTPYSFPHNIPSPKNAGDKYYLNFCVTQASGWIGPGNDFGQTAGACSTDDDFVHDKPYVHVYGADAVAGSSFKDGVCAPSATGAGINAYRSPVKGGSGVQFAAMAFGAISGFRSASTSPNPANYLSFANTTPGDGGSYNGDAICAHDFLSKVDNPTDITADTINVSGGGIADGHSLKQGDLTITGGTLSANKKAAIFVNEGNVYIKGNINFPVGSYLAIITNGNIYIDNSVTEISGLYVAQPRDGSTGSIYTCVNPASNQPYATPELYANCRTQLKINGAFVAERVKFLRVANSLRDSAAGEPVSASRAAEVFNFTPEMYLYSVIFGDNTATDQPYDYITTLPPVL